MLRLGRRGQLCGMRLQQFPRARDVTLGRAQMSDRETQRETPVQDRVRQKNLAGAVHRTEQSVVQRVELDLAHGPVAGPSAEADDAERYRREPLEIGIGVHPLAEQLRETDVLRERGPDALGSKMTKNHPKFQ